MVMAAAFHLDSGDGDGGRTVWPMGRTAAEGKGWNEVAAGDRREARWRRCSGGADARERRNVLLGRQSVE